MALHDHISKTQLEELNAKFAAEDAQAEKDPEVAESERVVAGHKAFSEHGAVPRNLGDVNYDDIA